MVSAILFRYSPTLFIRRFLLSALLLLTGVATVAAQGAGDSARAVGGTTRSYLIGLSHTNILDTYISQEKASGPELRYIFNKERRRDSSRVSFTVMHQAFITSSDTRGNDNSMLSAMYNLKFGWHCNWRPLRGLRLRAGGVVDATLGGLYNTRNSNNPAQARLALAIDPAVGAVWHFRLWHRPFALRYEAYSPLIGAAFSPNYGQSYYEIFSRGNYDHNIVFTQPGNAFQLHQLLLLDFRLWRATFSVGYMGDIRQLRANSLKYHQYSHGIVVGWRL
ncbi:MAG: DUF3316 domain-containing protein [Prevotella sp.]|nr:DUF3316 domain-containing protein [Prevotella sp.]